MYSNRFFLLLPSLTGRWVSRDSARVLLVNSRLKGRCRPLVRPSCWRKLSLLWTSSAASDTHSPARESNWHRWKQPFHCNGDLETCVSNIVILFSAKLTLPLRLQGGVPDVSDSWVSLCCATTSHPNINSLKQHIFVHFSLYCISWVKQLVLGSP